MVPDCGDGFGRKKSGVGEIEVGQARCVGANRLDARIRERVPISGDVETSQTRIQIIREGSNHSFVHIRTSHVQLFKIRTIHQDGLDTFFRQTTGPLQV